MKTRTSDRWVIKPGGFDKLNTRHIEFDGDWPILNCSSLFFNRVAFANNRRAISSGCLVSMFLEDYVLERYWNNPVKYTSRFYGVGGVMSPDYSLLLGMPVAMSMWNTYRSRLVGHVWQQAGINVVPTVSWGGPETFNFAFEGIMYGSIVAVSNVGCRNDSHKQYFDDGYNLLINKINPKNVVFQCNNKYIDYYADEKTIFIEPFFNQRKKTWGAGADKQ